MGGLCEDKGSIKKMTMDIKDFLRPKHAFDLHVRLTRSFGSGRSGDQILDPDCVHFNRPYAIPHVIKHKWTVDGNPDTTHHFEWQGRLWSMEHKYSEALCELRVNEACR